MEVPRRVIEVTYSGYCIDEDSASKSFSLYDDEEEEEDHTTVSCLRACWSAARCIEEILKKLIFPSAAYAAKSEWDDMDYEEV